MEIYKDKYQRIDFENDTKILSVEWFSENENMSEEEYKKASVSVPVYAENNGATKILINAINSKYIVTPEIQDWVNKNTVPKFLQIGVEKLAILLPAELFSHVSVEQIIDDTSEVAKKRILYFDNEQKAKEWLL